MKRILIFAIGLVFSTTFAVAQTKSVNQSPPLEEAAPESVGISSQRLARIDKMCEDIVKDDHLPGVVTLVARNGKIVHWKAFGMADNKEGRKLKRDDIFRIASQTKAITSTAVMMLWEEGKFKLDDPISKYIPEFKDVQVLKRYRYSDTTWTGEPAKNKITIRHLLTHTSGIGYGDIDSDERMKMIYQKAGIKIAFTTEPVTIEENIKKIAMLPLHFEPGTEYRYSMGFDVLGYFVEVVSGMPLDQFLKTRIFDPLGMEDTWFYLPKNKADRLVTVQQKVDDNWEKLPVSFYDTDYPIKGAGTLFSGGGGLCSTIKDYAIFLQMYLNGGEYNGVRLLSRTTVNTIMARQDNGLWNNSLKRYHGLAFGVLPEDGEPIGGRGSAGTFSWGGYFNTSYFADPVENTIGIIFKQTRGRVLDDTGWRFPLLVGQSIDD